MLLRTKQMDDTRQAVLSKFVEMYSGRASEAIRRYKATGEKHVILAECFDDPPTSRPDMRLRALSRESLLSELDTESVSVRLMMRQVDSLEPEFQAPLGLLFKDGNVLTHVVEFKKVSAKSK